MNWLANHNMMHGVIALVIIVIFGLLGYHWETYLVMVAFNYGIETRDNLWQRGLSGDDLSVLLPWNWSPPDQLDLYYVVLFGFCACIMFEIL